MKRKNKLSWLQRKVAAWLRPILDIHYQAKEWNLIRCPSCNTPAAAQDALYCRKCATPLHQQMTEQLPSVPTTLEMDARIIKAIASRETGALRKLYMGNGSGGTQKLQATLKQRKLIKDMHEFVNR